MIFTNKVVLVTGGASGIGEATALAFAKEGARVVIVDRNDKKLDKISTKLNGLTPHLALYADISDDTQAADVIKRTIDHFGQLDILVNNAGITRKGSILEGNALAVYDETMATNMRAIVQLTSLAAPHLIKTKGNIINTSSVWGLKSPKDVSFLYYCVSKAALTHFTKGVALELAPHGVRVNAISPGPVRTSILEGVGYTGSFEDFEKFTVLSRVSQPEEIAELFLFLASDKAKSITGSDYVIDNEMVLL